ncbi:hypothetical protein A7U60_g5579 [Sanghuangporus baumii]|uniref:DUF6533 domain-containing protein n=1 Tax=Sanghuangporus baumii TaxID=108892 RepID=A0A9Q5HWF4_SANBA|nr:hypothetical protein A7U60_g5579 [Sanghuangporus baumii]
MAEPDQSNIVIASEVYTARMSLVMTLTALVYDYLLSIGEEAELVWSSRLSVIKECVPVFLVFASFVFLQFYFSGLILVARAYAVWGGSRKKRSFFMLGMGCVVIWSPGFYCGVRFLKSATVSRRPVFPTGCLIGLNGHIDFLGMIDLLVSETAAVAVLLVKTVQMPHSSIMKRMSSDGILFYILILGATIANLIALNTTSPAVCNFLLAPQAALHSICCNRLLLRIRKAAAQTEFFHDSQLSPRESYLPSSQISGEGIEMHSI